MLAVVAGHDASIYATSPTPNAGVSVSNSISNALLESNPQLLIQPNSNRALALEAVTRRGEPFAPIAIPSFGSDNRTRITLYALGVDLPAPEDISAVTVDAEDGASQVYQLAVENIGRIPEYPDVTYFVVRLPDQLGEVGDVLVKITVHGLASNRARVGIGHVGDGPPDDPSATPTPTPSPGVTYAITGQVINNNGSALSGVTVNLANGAGFIFRTALTTTNGNFSFDSVAGGANFIVTASPTQLFAFNTIFFTNLSANGTAMFTGQPRFYSVSGRVTVGGSGLGNVTMTCNDGVSTFGTVTDSNGNYSFPQITAGRSLNINAVTSGYVFANGGITLIPNLISNTTGINFTASATATPTPTPGSPTVVPYATEILADSPQAYWRQSETSGTALADLSGNGRGATLSGSYGRQASSLLINNAPDPATTFSGGSFTSNTAFWSVTSGVSADFLIKFASVPAGGSSFPSFVSAGWWASAGGAFIFRYNAPNNSLQYVFSYSGGAADVGVEWVPTVGQIYHVAVTHDYATKTVVIYVDGKPIKTSVVAQTALPFSGKAVKVADSDLSADMDEPAIYSSALPASRIRAHFAAARGADATQTNYYASPSGSIYARGTYGDPLDLRAALSFSLIQPGATLIAKDGAYTAPSAASNELGIWTARLSGASGTPITIRSESQFGALLDGADRRGTVLRLDGSYLNIQGFDIRKHFATRTTTLVNPTGCSITNSDGQTVGGAGVSDWGTGNHIYYNYIHDVLGDGIGSFTTATQGEYYGNIIAHNGWTAPRTVGGPMDGNGHGIYTQNIGVNGQKKIEENIFFDPFSSPVAAKGSGSSYVENFLLQGNVCAYTGATYNVGGGVNGIHDITINGEMLWKVDFRPGYNSSENRDATITNNYIVGGSDQSPVQIADFNSLVYTGNESMSSQNAAQGGLFNYRIRTGHAYAESTVNNNIYWHNRTGTTDITGYAVGTGVPYSGGTFAQYKTATGWDAISTYHNPSPSNFAKPTTSRFFVRLVSRHQAGRIHFVVYNWAGETHADIDLSLSGLIPGQSYKIYNALDPLSGAVASGIMNPANPRTTLSLTPSVSQRYGDAAHSPLGTMQFNVFVIVPN